MWTALALSCLLGTAQPLPEALTGAERTEFSETSAYADVVRTLEAVQATSAFARRASMGTSGEGRDLPMLVLADPPVETPEAARAQAEASGKIIVLAIANIHAGEVEGKEALLMLARDLLRAQHAAVLKHAIILLAPIYNADGNERVSADHRPHQNGPKAVGQRENAKGRDLNRDFIKVEEAETRALLSTINAWDPHVFIDAHATDGSYHRYALTYAGAKNPAGDAAIVRYSREAFFPALSLMFQLQSGKHSTWYGNFEGTFGDAPRGHARWESFPADARFGTTYVGLRGRLSILTEAYVYDDFRTRVESTRDFIRLAIELAAENREQVRALVSEADRRAVELGGTVSEADDRVAIRWHVIPAPEPITILGFEETQQDGRTVRTDTPKDYTCELWDIYAPDLSVVRPWGYAIPEVPELARVLEALRTHGVRMHRLDASCEVAAERYIITQATSTSREFEGHAIVHAEASARAEVATLGTGTWIVPSGQPLGNLVVYLLEPQCEDGLAAWNYLDSWMKAGAEYPVLRLMAEPRK